MPTLTVTNLSSTQTQVISPTDGFGVAVTLNPSQTKVIPMTTLQIDEIQSGLVSLTLSGAISWSVAQTSGLSDKLDALSPLTADRMGPVAATAVAAAPVSLHFKWAAPGGGGSPAEVVMLAALPSKMRVLDVLAVTTAGATGATLQIFSQTASGGTQLTDAMVVDVGTVQRMNYVHASSVLTPATGTGLFLELSDNSVAGEVTVLCRYEV